MFAATQKEIRQMIKPTPVQAAWQDMEIGMFYHFDIPVYKQGWEWRSFANCPAPDLYQPVRLDTDQWMEAASAIGARYAVFVAKHCSGFLQYQSDLYPYGVKQSSWRDGKGDVVEAFVASCRKYDIKPGLYASVGANGFLGVDRYKVNKGRGDDPKAQEEYRRITEKMAEELWSRYGELTEIWFDGGVPPISEGGPDLLPLYNRHQPNAVAFQGPAEVPNLIRWVGNERGLAPYPCWNTSFGTTSEGGTVEKKGDRFSGHPDGNRWIPGECDVPIRNHEWFWKPDQEDKLYSVEELMNMYYKSVGRNCNLLLNANPDPDGLIPEADMERYIEFGREIQRRFSQPMARTDGAGETIELSLDAPTDINHVIIMEDIAQGERIRTYVVEGLGADRTWRPLCEGESVGHKRIQSFETKSLQAIRLRVTTSVAEPLIRELAVYNVK